MSNKTILFADDSATMRTIMERTFAAEPYEVVCVASGEGAVAKAKEVRPSVIIVDAGMPGVSGYDVCKAVRADAAVSGTPVILMSGVSNLYDDVRGQEAGVTEHMKKPFDTGMLIEMVSDLVAFSAAPAVQDVPFDDVEPEDLPLEPLSEPALSPDPEELSLSEPPIPISEPPTAIFESAVPLVSMPEQEPRPIPLGVPSDGRVGKETQDYARPSSFPPASVEDPLPEDEVFGEEVDFGDGEMDAETVQAPSDVPPIEIGSSEGEDADSSSFHVGTLAELAQMDSKGHPLETEPHEEAIELSPTASSLASLGPQMTAEPEIPPAVDAEDGMDRLSDLPDMPDDEEEPISIHETFESEVPAPPAHISVSASAAASVSAQANAAAEEIAAKVEGITPTQAAAIQTLTQEIIERVVWEVVPDLAEVIIKEELSKLLKE